MVLPSRALRFVVPLCALSACGTAGGFPAAQDAKLIVTSVTPVVRSASGYGASAGQVAQITGNLSRARGEAATMGTQFSPNQLDVQEFYGAAQPLLQTLAALPGLPPDAAGTVDAAAALLPGIAAVADIPVGGPQRMNPAQARLILQGTPAPPAPAPAAPPPPSAGRFHLSADDFAGTISYQFFDGGQVVEKGTAASLRALEAKFEAFKKER